MEITKVKQDLKERLDLGNKLSNVYIAYKYKISFELANELIKDINLCENG